MVWGCGVHSLSKPASATVRVYHRGCEIRPDTGFTVGNWSEQISQGSVLVTVNQRLSRHHVQQYQAWQMENGNTWWETPSILPFRSWLSATHRTALSMGLSDVTLMPVLLVNRQWQRIVNADTSLYLLDPVGAARAAVQAWDLSCAWQCVNDEQAYLSVDQRTWQRWMNRYRSWLDENSAIDEALLPDELVRIISHAPEYALQKLLPESLILDGFLQLPQQLATLVELIESKGTQVKLNKPESNAFVHTQTYQDDETELFCIAAQMRHMLEHHPQKRLGLVVPDLQQRRDSVVRAFERVFYPCKTPLEIAREAPAYEVSLGQPLADQPVISSALLMTELCTASISHTSLSHVVLSPYWTHAKDEARAREKLDRRLRDTRVRSLTLTQFEEQLFKYYRTSELVPAVKKVLKKRKTVAASLGEWASRFSSWLALLGWPGKSLDSQEYQAVAGWFECLDDMQLLDDGELVDCSAALATLKSLAGERIFQLETPATPINLMGRLESHGLGFDCLWVAGLDNEQWPPAGSANSFLQIAQQKERGVPAASATGRLLLAETEFKQWASQAPLLIGSSVLNRDGKDVAAAQIPTTKPSAQNTELALPMVSSLAELGLPVDPVTLISKTLHLECITDENGPALEANASASGGASLFQNQAKCPFRAFALHRLNVQPLEEAGLGLDAREHGNVLHKVMELFWTEHVTHRALMALSDEALEGSIEKAVLEAMDECEVPDDIRELERIRLVKLTSDWITRCEKPREPFSVVGQERRQSIEFSGISMNVIVDRIDDIDGMRVVVDYKTGVNDKATTWDEARIPNPQLPLYALSIDDIEGVCFARVANNQCRYIGIASEAGVVPDVKTSLYRVKDSELTGETLSSWSAWQNHWKASLDPIAREVKDGVATVTPTKNACQYCELKSLCRISSDTTDDDEDPDEKANDTREADA